MPKRFVVFGLVVILAWHLAAALPSASRGGGEQAQASRTPWSGWWWPLLDSRDPNLYDDGGPLEKYDAYVNKVTRRT